MEPDEPGDDRHQGNHDRVDGDVSFHVAAEDRPSPGGDDAVERVELEEQLICAPLHVFVDDEQDTRSVQQQSEDEGEQVLDVFDVIGGAGSDQSEADVQHRLQHDDDRNQEPCEPNRFAGDDADHRHHDQRGQEGKQLGHGGGDRQQCAREPDRLEERPVAGDRFRRVGDGGGRVLVAEQTDRDEGEQVVHPAGDVEDDAEDQVEHRNLQRRVEEVPEVAEHGVHLLATQLATGNVPDVVAPIPDREQVGPDTHPHIGGEQTVRFVAALIEHVGRHRWSSLRVGPSRAPVVSPRGISIATVEPDRRRGRDSGPGGFERCARQEPRARGWPFARRQGDPVVPRRRYGRSRGRLDGRCVDCDRGQTLGGVRHRPTRRTFRGRGDIGECSAPRA